MHVFSLAVLLTAIQGPPAAEKGRGIELHAAVVQLIERTELAAEDAGVLQQMQVKVGEAVRRGDALAQLKDAEARALLNQAVLELKHARIEAASMTEIERMTHIVEFRRADWTRADETARRSPGSFSQLELDKKELDLEEAKLNLAAALEKQKLFQATAEIKENSLDRATKIWERHRIVSPVDGIVERIDRRVGEWVEAGSSLFVIVRSDRLRVQGLMRVDDFVPGLQGGPVELYFDAPQLRGEQFRGTVSFVSTENDPRTNDIRVWVEFDNPGGRVRHGMRARARISRDDRR